MLPWCHERQTSDIKEKNRHVEMQVEQVGLIFNFVRGKKSAVFAFMCVGVCVTSILTQQHMELTMTLTAITITQWF